MGLAEKIRALEKRVDPFTFAHMSEKPKLAVSSGSIIVDAAIGIGGFPEQGISEIAGEYSSGKTTMALEMCREVQERKTKNIAVFADFEHALDLNYAKKLGVDVTPFTKGGKFITFQPMSLEEGWEIILDLMDEPEIGIVICDSVAAMTPAKIMTGVEVKDIGLKSRLMAEKYAVAASKCHKNSIPLILLNQFRVHLSGQGKNMKASEETTGGNALKFYCLVRLWLHASSRIMQDKQDPITLEVVPTRIGQYVRFEVVKNKVASPFKAGRFVIKYNQGIDNVQTLIDMAKPREIIKMSRGGHYIVAFPGEEPIKGRGATDLNDFLNDPLIVDKLVKIIDVEHLWDNPVIMERSGGALDEGRTWDEVEEEES